MAFASSSLSVVGPVAHALQVQARPGGQGSGTSSSEAGAPLLQTDQAGNGNATCCICLEDDVPLQALCTSVDKDGKLVHFACEYCLDQWRQRGTVRNPKTCPLCRARSPGQRQRQQEELQRRQEEQQRQQEEQQREYPPFLSNELTVAHQNLELGRVARCFGGTLFAAAPAVAGYVKCTGHVPLSAPVYCFDVALDPVVNACGNPVVALAYAGVGAIVCGCGEYWVRQAHLERRHLLERRRLYHAERSRVAAARAASRRPMGGDGAPAQQEMR
ncbi:unnamed protein product [Amoebophrya sp. A120]|nr:unnamed protein product [Amoebophrya sp. A120]|eukprot:GSA120T00023127001.1